LITPERRDPAARKKLAINSGVSGTAFDGGYAAGSQIGEMVILPAGPVTHGFSERCRSA